MESIRIIATCVLATIFYEIVQDQVAAKICVEYLKNHPHPNLSFMPAVSAETFQSCLLAMLFGSCLAFAAQFGNRPKVKTALVVNRILLVAILTGIGALASGTLTEHLSAQNALLVPITVAPGRRALFSAVSMAYTASSTIGITGAFAVFLSICQMRLSSAQAAQDKA